jgi:hypothetical protein
MTNVAVREWMCERTSEMNSFEGIEISMRLKRKEECDFVDELRLDELRLEELKLIENELIENKQDEEEEEEEIEIELNLFKGFNCCTYSINNKEQIIF